MWTQALWLNFVTVNTIPHWTDAWNCFAEWKTRVSAKYHSIWKTFCMAQRQGFKSILQPFVWIQWPHRQFALGKTWTRLNGCSHWIHLYLHNGPLGPRFIEEKGCMNVEKGAVIVSFSYLQGSRNNPEFHMIGLPYPSRADQGQGGLTWIQLSMKLSFEFKSPRQTGNKVGETPCKLSFVQ